jgi:hypothetical protein
MAFRKPLVIVSGFFSELPVGDSTVGLDLAAAPSGIIYVGTKLGIDGSAQISGNAGISAAVTAQASGNAALIVSSTALASGNAGISAGLNALSSGNFAQSTGTTALASGNAAQSTANTALVSGNAALSRAGGTMTGPIVFAAGQQITTAVNLSGSISGAIPYQSAPNATTFLSPGASGQVLTTAGSNLAPLWTTPGGGKILQAVQSTLTSTFVTTSLDYVSSGLTLSITPSSTSSRILVIASVSHYTGQGSFSRLSIFRNDITNLLTNTFPGFTNIWNYAPGGGFNNALAVTFNFIDSPSTTSATTYSVYVGCTTGSPSTFAYFNRFNYNGDNNAPGTAVLQAFEIAP